MVDGAAALMTIFHGALQFGWWHEERGTNMLDTGAHFYDVYETKDGKYVSIGSIERQFYAELLEKTGLAGEELPSQMDRSEWPAMKQRLAAIFRTKTSAEWCRIMEGSDVCFAPVLSMTEVPGPPPYQGAQHLRRGRRRQPAGAGAALQPIAAEDRAPTAACRAAHRRSPGGLGIRGGRDCRTARGEGHRLS